MSSAPASNARLRKRRGPVSENHDVEVRVLAGAPVQEQEGAVPSSRRRRREADRRHRAQQLIALRRR